MDNKELNLKSINLRISNLKLKLNMVRDPLARASIVADIETARMEKFKIEKSLEISTTAKEEKSIKKEKKEIKVETDETFNKVEETPVLNRGIVAESPSIEEAENLLDILDDKKESDNKNNKYNNKKKH